MIEMHIEDLAAVTSMKQACALLGASVRRPAIGGGAHRSRDRGRRGRSRRTCSLRPNVSTCCRCWVRPSTATSRRCRCGHGCWMTASTCVRFARCTGCWRSRERTASRRRQRTHPAKKKPELIVTAPNRVWSWDITKLQGPTCGTYYELFVIIDIFSRYVVGWMVSPAETGELAEAFIAEALAVHGIARDQLTLHADRGASMTSKPVAQLLVDLGVARSHSRPHVSNDNPYSEANFKTLKYCPAFPSHFGSIEDARAVLHAVLRPLQPCAPPCRDRAAYPRVGPLRHRHRNPRERAATLNAAYAANPARFRHRKPHPPKLPTVAWINEPTPEALIKSA